MTDTMGALLASQRGTRARDRLQPSRGPSTRRKRPQQALHVPPTRSWAVRDLGDGREVGVVRQQVTAYVEQAEAAGMGPVYVKTMMDDRALDGATVRATAQNPHPRRVPGGGSPVLWAPKRTHAQG